MLQCTAAMRRYQAIMDVYPSSSPYTVLHMYFRQFQFCEIIFSSLKWEGQKLPHSGGGCEDWICICECLVMGVQNVKGVQKCLHLYYSRSHHTSPPLSPEYSFYCISHSAGKGTETSLWLHFTIRIYKWSFHLKWPRTVLRSSVHDCL